MVLGIQLLATFGNIKCNFQELTMEFECNNKKMVLRGTPKAPMHWLEGKKQVQMMEHNVKS